MSSSNPQTAHAPEDRDQPVSARRSALADIALKAGVPPEDVRAFLAWRNRVPAIDE